MSFLKKIYQSRYAFVRLMSGGQRKRKLLIEELHERNMLRVEGEEVVPFLQGLMTNDLNQLASTKTPYGSLYTMFLNKSGRVLYDAIIYPTLKPTTYLIECDRNVASELRRHLRLHRVRRKIEIDCVDTEYKPWVAFDPEIDAPTAIDTSRLPPDVFYTPDPRLRELGVRMITAVNKTFNDLSKYFLNYDKTAIKEANIDCNYRMLRYHHGVGEGIVDLPTGNCFALECNADYLNGVSFNKGCYIGQELTARVHHTGVVRKRLMPLILSKPSQAKNVQNQAGTNVGTIRGVYLDRALALMRVDMALAAQELSIDGDSCSIVKPKWWPNVVHGKSRFASDA